MIKEYVKMRAITLLWILLVVGCPIFSQTQHNSSLPNIIQDFLNQDSLPFGKAAENAPPEISQFGQLAGIWKCSEQTRDVTTGKFTEVGKSFWVWKFILNGFGMQDLWFQPVETYPYSNMLQRDLILTQIRVYDTKEYKWKIAFINNTNRAIPGRVFGTFEAQAKEDHLIMPFTSRDGSQKQRIVFYNISKNHFDWNFEVFDSENQKWKCNYRIVAEKVKWL